MIQDGMIVEPTKDRTKGVIAEYSALSSPLTAHRTYTWGLDICRTLADAGGVRGLLLVTQVTTGQHYLPAYDGNGNILALVNRSSGSLDAVYEYSPFGEPLRATGSYAQTNPIRFSTKYTDDETGLVYYGRRYYNPSLGRFVGRDPMEEKGGLHLYAFVRNNPINSWDYLGMDEADDLLKEIRMIEKELDHYSRESGMGTISELQDKLAKLRSQLNALLGPAVTMDPFTADTTPAPTFTVTFSVPSGPTFTLPEIGSSSAVSFTIPGITDPCPELNKRLAIAQTTQSKYAGYFAKNGSLAAFSGATSAADVSSILSGMGDVGLQGYVLATDAVNNSLDGMGSISSLDGERGPPTPSIGTLPGIRVISTGLLAVGVATDSWKLGDAIVDRDGNEILSSSASLGLTAIGVSLAAVGAAPAAFVVGAAQLGANIIVFAYQSGWNDDLKLGFANAVSQSRATLAQADQTIAGIEAEKKAQGCPP